MSFNLNDCSLVSAEHHARPCRDNKRGTRQMVTAALVPSEDDFDASFTDEHSKPPHVWLVCPHTLRRRRRFTGAMFSRPSLDFHQGKSVAGSRDPAEKPSNDQRLSEHHAPDYQTQKDRSQTSKSAVAWDGH